MLEGLLIYTLAHYGSKMIYRKMTDSHELFIKILNEGLYHVTTKENAKKIITGDHPEIWASGHLASYGSKKAFFFAGVPNYEALLANCRTMLQPKITAVKLQPKYEELASFSVREYNDQIISYDGNVDLQQYKEEQRLHMVELGMKYKNGHYYYEALAPGQEYLPSPEVLQYFAHQQGLQYRITTNLKSYGIDMKYFYQNTIKRFVRQQQNKITQKQR